MTLTLSDSDPKYSKHPALTAHMEANGYRWLEDWKANIQARREQGKRNGETIAALDQLHEIKPPEQAEIIPALKLQVANAQATARSWRTAAAILALILILVSVFSFVRDAGQVREIDVLQERLTHAITSSIDTTSSYTPPAPASPTPGTSTGTLRDHLDRGAQIASPASPHDETQPGYREGE
jgi:hypothetical protein